MGKKKFSYTDHPSITIVNRKPRLRIFEDFAIEERLPKFAVKVNVINKNSIHVDDSGIVMTPDEFRAESATDATESRDYYELRRVLEGFGAHVSDRNSARWDRERYIRNKLTEMKLRKGRVDDRSKGSLLQELFSKFKKKPSIEVEETNEFDIEEAFNRLKAMLEIPSCALLEKHKRLIDASIKRLEDAGQFAKADEVNKNAFVLASELTLAKDARFSKYLTEDNVIQMMLKSEKGINVEFLRYYGELMPSDVIEKKIEADKLNIFDNYAVIHYDKTIENFKQIVTVEEERKDRIRRRDPILVGLIQGSRKLYYIADWVTKEDDLTLLKVEQLLGIKAPVISAFDSEIKTQEDNEKFTDDTLARLESIRKTLDEAVASIDADSEL